MSSEKHDGEALCNPNSKPTKFEGLEKIIGWTLYPQSDKMDNSCERYRHDYPVRSLWRRLCAKREQAKINYHIHTDAIKENYYESTH